MTVDIGIYRSRTFNNNSRPAIKNQVTEVNLSDKCHDNLLILILVSKYFLHRQLLLRYANLFKDMLISLSVKAKNKLNLHVSVVSVALVRTCSRTKFPQSLINLGSKGCVLLVHGTGYVQVKFQKSWTRNTWAALETPEQKNEKWLTLPKVFRVDVDWYTRVRNPLYVWLKQGFAAK